MFEVGHIKGLVEVMLGMGGWLRGPGHQRVEHTENSVVVGFGAATGEDDLLRPGVEERGNLVTGGFDGSPGALTEGVDGRGVAELAGKIGKHGLQDRRVDGGGGVVIEVDVVHGSARNQDRGGMSQCPVGVVGQRGEGVVAGKLRKAGVTVRIAPVGLL
jgi:hypothetical protein